ncbi:hypothetical protein C8F01DRAFT_1058537 [Mycena amicta]|nr:hypothetical protein C8F01DRAFT_1058537 [Mycena amicta]
MDIDDWGSASSTDSQSDSEGPSSPPPLPAQPLPKLKLILPPLRELQQQKQQHPPTPPPPPQVYYDPAPAAGPSSSSKKSKSSKNKSKTSSHKSKSKRKFAFSEYADESGSKAPPRPVKLKPLKEVLARLLVLLKKKDDYAFFLKPVNAALVPGYADLIKRPMDLATMTVKVQRGRYRSLEEFTDDFRLVTGNAKIFNPPDSIYYIEAERLETWGLDQISKAASTVIQYETDWNIEIEREDVTAEDYAAALEDVEMAGPERSRSPSVSLGGPMIGSLRRGPLRPRAAKEEPNANVPVKETIDAEGRMPGSKDGMGAFPAGSAWAKTMLSLKLKGKRYKTKKERLRVETHGPPTLTDGSLDYRAVEDPFTYLSALVPDPPARPQLTPIFPPPRKPPPPTFQPSGTPSRDTPEPSGAGETPAPNVLDTYPLPTLLPHDLQTTTTTIPSNLRHWTVHRNFGNRRPLDPPPAYERTWEEPREAHMLDFGAFAELAGLLNGALRGAGLPVVETQTREETDALVKDAVRASLEVPSRDQFVAPTTVLDLQPTKEYWGKERMLEAESYIVDMVYGGVEGLAYVRSLAEFVSTPAGDEDVKMEDVTKPQVFPLGCSLASWVEQTIVGPLTEGRHQLLNRVVQELSIPKRENGTDMKIEAIDIDDKIPAQIALACDVRPVAFTGLKLIQQVLTHKLDMAALLYAPTEVAQSEAEWAGAAIGVGVGAGSTAQTKAVLDHTANLLERLQTPSVKDEPPHEGGGGGESKTLRNLRLNLLALVRRAPVDTIAMLPPELVREDLRPFIPTLPAHGTLSYIQ